MERQLLVGVRRLAASMTLAVSLVHAVNAQDCDKVLRDGVFNTSMTQRNADFARTFNSFLYISDFYSHQQAIDAGLSVGTIVYGVPLKIGGTFSKKEKEEWRRMHQQHNAETTSASERYSQMLTFAAPEILQAWTKCIEVTRQRPGLSAWLEDAGNADAVLHLNWIPIAGDTGTNPTVRHSSISGGTRSDNGQTSVLPAGYVVTPGANANLIPLRRTPKSALVTVVSTSRGDVAAILSAPPKPSILSFVSSPQQVQLGNSSILTWTVSKADRVFLNNGIGAVAESGSFSVTPDKTTTYVLTAENSSGSDVRNAKVEVVVPTINSVLLTIHTEDDDKDKEEAVEVWILSGGGDQQLAHAVHGSNEKWNDRTSKSFDFKLNPPIKCSDSIKVRIFKHPHGSPTGCGWHMSIEATGTCSDGKTVVLKPRSGTAFMGDGRQNHWDRTW